MGYSLSDPDVLSILEDIVACLPEEKVSVLGERFVFVEYNRDKKESVITSHSIVVHERVINMTKIVTSCQGKHILLKREPLRNECQCS